MHYKGKNIDNGTPLVSLNYHQESFVNNRSNNQHGTDGKKGPKRLRAFWHTLPAIVVNYIVLLFLFLVVATISKKIRVNYYKQHKDSSMIYQYRVVESMVQMLSGLSW